MSDQVRIRVLAFGSAVAALGWTQREYTLTAPATLADLIRSLEQECPRLLEARGRVRYAVNEQYAAAEAALHADDEVAIIPPVSGGDVEEGRRADARLTRAPIDLAALYAEVSDASCGAIASFVGIVRAERDASGHELEALEYEAYETMALGEMQRIAAEQCGSQGVWAVRVVHRLGRLTIGEASVAVVVSSEHRAAALAACREIMEQVKAGVPIFKREIWRDAPPTWVDPIS